MKRFALQDLIIWKNKKNRKPLIVNGARQVGKTWLLQEFGKNQYKEVLYINFERNKRMQNLFKQDLNPNRILLGLELEHGHKIDVENTLIIFDEIQTTPQAITSLKYFFEETPQYHIVAAGSLLGVTLHSGVSFPVGKVDRLNLYPLNFYEYLDALGQENLVELLKSQNFEMIRVFKDTLLDYLKQYMYIGGMPEVVVSFIRNKDFHEVRQVQNHILLDYSNDFSKHIPKETLPKVLSVWNSIPAQLAKENKKFFYNNVAINGRAKDFEDAITWLIDSGLIYKVNRLTKPFLPIKGYQENNIFKLFMLDVGLLSAMSKLDRRILLEGDNLFTEFKGSITEQYVLQELMSLSDIEVSYWGNDSGQAEVDFVVQCESNVFPVESKAGTNLKAKSLKVYMDKYNPKFAIRTSQADYKKTDTLYDIPLYMMENIKLFCAK
ncbi:MAG: ATP-binding protein [Alphaproteobacteria bacterium]|nr:ATP-binding protein [Alphaproteobacteria bacterium]